MRNLHFLRHSVLLLSSFICLGISSCAGGGGSTPSPPPPPTPQPTTFSNPIQATIAGGGVVETCADPSIIRGRGSDTNWYVYCTGDPLNDTDKTNGGWTPRLIPILRTSDFATWSYVGTVFVTKPAWAASDAGLWAPEIHYINGKYYLYYTASKTVAGGAGIGVGVSNSPTGPWADAGAPVVEPQAASECNPPTRWVIDPNVVEVNGQLYIYYGSYCGGISVRALSADGLHSDAASETRIALPDRYEASYIVKHDGYLYLLVSAGDCCRGPLSGYSVFAARATNPLGPFVDKDGRSLMDPKAGGTMVLAANGNRWIGPGHIATFTDYAGQDWMVYHAVDRNHPYFANSPGFTKRPLMLDAIHWVNDWPTVRGGSWASDSAQPLPAAQPGSTTNYRMTARIDDQAGAAIAAFSDEFNGASLGAQWSWVRPPSSTVFRHSGSSFDFDTQAADLFQDNNTASVLVESAPASDFMIETRLRVSVPQSGCCFNYTQGGVVIYGGDDNYIRLTVVANNNTRAIEFGKELYPVPSGYPRYGSTYLEAPGDWTYLRIVRRTNGGVEAYTPYSSSDGVTWARGGTWTHALGTNIKMRLVSMGGAGYTTSFDYVRVYNVAN